MSGYERGVTTRGMGRTRVGGGFKNLSPRPWEQSHAFLPPLVLEKSPTLFRAFNNMDATQQAQYILMALPIFLSPANIMVDQPQASISAPQTPHIDAHIHADLTGISAGIQVGDQSAAIGVPIPSLEQLGIKMPPLVDTKAFKALGQLATTQLDKVPLEEGLKNLESAVLFYDVIINPHMADAPQKYINALARSKGYKGVEGMHDILMRDLENFIINNPKATFSDAVKMAFFAEGGFFTSPTGKLMKTGWELKDPSLNADGEQDFSDDNIRVRIEKTTDHQAWKEMLSIKTVKNLVEGLTNKVPWPGGWFGGGDVKAAEPTVAPVSPTPTRTETPVPPTATPTPEPIATMSGAEFAGVPVLSADVIKITDAAYQKILGTPPAELKYTEIDANGEQLVGLEGKPYILAYDSQTGFPRAVAYRNTQSGEWEWMAATFNNNPYGIVFGYTDRIDPKDSKIANGQEPGKLFSPEAKYPSNQFSPLRNIDKTIPFDGTQTDQPSFFVDGKIDETRLEAFIDSANSTYRGVVFTGRGIKLMPKDNPNQYVMVVSGQNQINVAFDKMNSTTAEEAFVWYITNTTKEAIKNDVKIFGLNELVRSDNYWPEKLKKSPEQIIELAIKAVRLAAGDKVPNLKFMINDGDVDKSSNSSLGKILQIIQNLDKKGIAKPNEIIIGTQYHNGANYNVANLNKVFEKLYAAGIRDVRLTEVDIMGKQKPSDEQILKYYKDLIKAVKEQKKLHPDLNISVVFFDEAWGTDYLGNNSRITDLPKGIYQLLTDLFK